MDATDLQENYGTASSPNKVSDSYIIIYYKLLTIRGDGDCVRCRSLLAYKLFISLHGRLISSNPVLNWSGGSAGDCLWV